MSISSFFFNKKKSPKGNFFDEKSHEVLVKKLSYKVFGEIIMSFVLKIP